MHLYAKVSPVSLRSKCEVFEKKIIFISTRRRMAISQSARNGGRVFSLAKGLHGGLLSRARPGVPIPACHNRGMSSPLGWPAHGCATELFIPLDYTRRAEPRRAEPSRAERVTETTERATLVVLSHTHRSIGHRCEQSGILCPPSRYRADDNEDGKRRNKGRRTDFFHSAFPSELFVYSFVS